MLCTLFTSTRVAFRRRKQVAWSFIVFEEDWMPEAKLYYVHHPQPRSGAWGLGRGVSFLGPARG